MPQWICLIRGINVGGKNILPMKQLQQMLLSMGISDVATYIQSGNVVFNAKARSANSLADAIADAIQANHKFRPGIHIVKPQDLRTIIDENPFAEKANLEKSLHCFFLANKATTPDMAAIKALKSSSEQFHLSDRAFYLFAPDGIGRSKLAAKVEKLLGVPTTARNWNTVMKLKQMTDPG
jgi:uncharacterized protein (DUF1697 family)